MTNPPVSDDHARLEQAITKVGADLNTHRSEFQKHVASHEVVDAKIIRLTDSVTMLVDLLYGEAHPGPDGTVLRDGGLQELIKQSANGGVRIHIPPSITALLVALIGAVGAVAAALIARTTTAF